MKDPEVTAYGRIAELKKQLETADAVAVKLRDQIAVLKDEVNRLHAQNKNLESELLKASGGRQSLADLAAKEQDLKTFPSIADELGGVHAQQAAKLLYMDMKRNKGSSPTAIRTFTPEWTSQLVFGEQVLCPGIVFVAPHLRERPQCPLKCPCETSNQAEGKKKKDAQPTGPHQIKCVGVKSAKTLFTPSGPMIFITFGYECYRNKEHSAGTETIARHKSDEFAFAEKNRYDHELCNFILSKSYVFRKDLVESTHFLYSCTPCTMENVVAHYRGVYALSYYYRFRDYLGKLHNYLLPDSGQQTLDHNLNQARLRTIDASWNSEYRDPPGAWGFFSVDTLKLLIIAHANSLKQSQDMILANHIPGTSVLSGDHQFSASRFLQSFDGSYDFKGIYTLLSEKHYCVSVVWIRDESYAALKNLFDFVKTLTTPLVIYVDKCCGRGSFGDCIRRYFGSSIIVLLDLFHAIRRLRKAARKHCESTRRFIAEMSRQHWKLSPAWEHSSDISDVPQSERSIPPPVQLLAQLQTVMDKYAKQPCMTESVLVWGRITSTTSFTAVFQILPWISQCCVPTAKSAQAEDQSKMSHCIGGPRGQRTNGLLPARLSEHALTALWLLDGISQTAK